MTDLGEQLVGLLLIFGLPGFSVIRALFPERRVFRPLSWRTLVEQLTGSLVLSVGLTILVGYGWLGLPVGVQASWSDPLLEVSLALISVVGLSVASWRGSFDRVPPRGPPLEPETGHSDPMEIVRRLDALARTERSLQHRIRVAGPRSAEAEALVQELDGIRSEAARLRAEREEEYARP